MRKPIRSVAEFCAEADRIGLTADTLAAQLAKRPEFADCLPQISEAVDVEAAAMKMAECMDHPWSEMPEEGRAHMRTFAQSVVNAALAARKERDARA
ncbi:hypothetical protein L529_3779 [Bordetella bronchiseptica MBORD901]|nr:hypothetical protein L529_3779 [Bordetella bronchiseptica MBORD901]